MDYLKLEDIVACALPDADVEVPEWGGKVKVRALTSAEVARCERQSTNGSGRTDGMELQARMVETGLVEPKLNPGQYKALMGKEPGPIVRIAARIMQLSGMEEEEAEQGES